MVPIALLLVLLLATGCVPLSAAAYAHSFTFRRTVAASVNITYTSCVRAWREENLGLPPLLVTPPILWKHGDQASGKGLVLVRIPPAALQEGIVDAMTNQWIEYRVLNPGWFTWPVLEHRGRIVFNEVIQGEGESAIESLKIRNSYKPLRCCCCCTMEWTVDFTPLPLPMVFGDSNNHLINECWVRLLQRVMEAIVDRAVRHVATKAETRTSTNLL